MRSDTLNVIDTRWYGSEQLSYQDLADGKATTDIISWAVLIYNYHHFRCFIWVWTAGDEALDTRQIHRWWNSVPKEVALAIFWNRETDIAWVHATVETHYRF